MSWRPAKAIEQFRKEINEKFPGRNKASDGIVGDLKHAQRKSSHNPDSRGAVRAMDVTHDPERGIDGHKLLAALLASPDPRIWYIIFDKKIYNKKDGFQARPYTGINAHRHHLHLSVSDDPKLYDDERAWNLNLESAAKDEKQEAEASAPSPQPPTVLKAGDRGEKVKEMQNRLRMLGLLKVVDGDFGPLTLKAVKDFQIMNKLRVDGLAGPNTLRLLNL